MAMKVEAEYAKSGRSSCKGCTNSIASGALRLGSSTKDHRGFDLVKWYHLRCFPLSSRSIASGDQIKGFDSLKDGDQKALRKLWIDGASGQTLNESAADLQENGSKIDFHISHVKGKYKDASLPPKWKAFRTLIFRETEEGLYDSEKIAAFDFDGCLANTSVKIIGADAWSLMYPSIPEKLQDLYNKGYKLVIFTNESNIERWNYARQKAVDSKIGRLDNFVNHVFIACGMDKNKDQSDQFRKPKSGMWRLMEQHFNSGILVDMDQSFYVGDAAGRNNDHSDADIKFAEALGLKFYVPEEFFVA